MFFNRWLIKQHVVVHSYHEILLSENKEWTIDVCNNWMGLKEIILSKTQMVSSFM